MSVVLNATLNLQQIADKAYITVGYLHVVCEELNDMTPTFSVRLHLF